jgi:hypothetical protein
MNDIPAAKIKMMKSSIRCLIFGMLALLPVIGLPFGLAALWIAGRVRLKEKIYWNAAKPYRVYGVVCAAVGTILGTGILGVAVVRALAMAYG